MYLVEENFFRTPYTHGYIAGPPGRPCTETLNDKDKDMEQFTPQRTHQLHSLVGLELELLR